MNTASSPNMRQHLEAYTLTVYFKAGHLFRLIIQKENCFLFFIRFSYAYTFVYVSIYPQLNG